MRPLLLTLLFLCASPSFAHGGGHSSSSGRTYSHASSSRSYRSSSAPRSTSRTSTRAYHAPRSTPRSNRHAEKKRSIAAKDAFKRQQPCPSTGRSSGRCPGYVVDHRVALACGGADDPSNMQWQTTTAARLKDKTERKGCR